MLKEFRIAFASLFFVGITLLFAGIGADWWGWMAKVQFMPSLMRVIASATALNIAVLAALILVTVLVGRIYCSVICPLGVWQDLVNWLSSRRKGKKRRFRFKKENSVVRNLFWALYFAAVLFGIQAVIALFAPYSAWGRIVRSIVAPVGTGWVIIAVAAVTLAVTGLMAWFGGRTYCNTVCPVGTTLGLFSRWAVFGPVIDTDKCTHCHGCEKQCKASCIDSKNQIIDYSRCVDCFDCIEDCKFGAIRFGNTWKRRPRPAAQEEPEVDSSKRAFLGGAALLLGSAALKAQDIKLDGGLARIEAKRKPERTERIVPPGAVSLKNFYERCTACQLCVASCPNHVLRPSTDLEHLMQPEASFENGYCRPECSECSQVCPAGAILPVTPEERTQIHVGTAVVDYDLCVAYSDDIACGNCHRHCPADAIVMVRKNPADRHSLLFPTVDESKCIGCGACEYLCPARPISAIKVNGLKVHVNG